MSIVRLFVGLAFILCLGSCSNSSSTAPTPTPEQIAGVWTGTSGLTSVTGGECVGATFNQIIGISSPITLSIQQSGTALTATATTQATGISCTHSGTSGMSTISLTATSCQVNSVSGIHCSNGAVRDAVLLSDAINLSLNGNALTGTESQTFNVFVSGTTTSVGSLTLSSNLAL